MLLAWNDLKWNLCGLIASVSHSIRCMWLDLKCGSFQWFPRSVCFIVLRKYSMCILNIIYTKILKILNVQLFFWCFVDFNGYGLIFKNRFFRCVIWFAGNLRSKLYYCSWIQSITGNAVGCNSGQKSKAFTWRKFPFSLLKCLVCGYYTFQLVNRHFWFFF